MQDHATWTIDPSHTKIGFSVRHFGITETDGFFRNYAGTVKSEREDFTDMAVEMTVFTGSIDTQDEKRDAHLRADDFFASDRFPEMRFKSNRVLLTDIPNEYKLEGILTIRDISKPMVFDVESAGIVPKDPFGNTKAGFFLTGTINRQEFGLSFNVLLGTGNLAVADKVKIICPVQLTKVA